MGREKLSGVLKARDLESDGRVSLANGRKSCIEEGEVKARLSGLSRSRVTEPES